MTNLETSPVVRRTTATFKNKRIVIKLRKDDQIELRLERARKPELVVPIRFLLEHPAVFANVSIPARRV